MSYPIMNSHNVFIGKKTPVNTTKVMTPELGKRLGKKGLSEGEKGEMN